MAKEIIIITRHYPPEAAGGSRRPWALASGLRALGCHVRIVAPLGAEDPELMGVAHPIFPFLPDSSSIDKSTQTFGDLFRRWLLLPDPEVRWAFRCLRAIRKANLRPDWIITTSPPESLHLIGAILRTQLKCRWLADVRDLWLSSPQRKERNAKWRQVIERVIARATLAQADAFVAVSPIVLAEAESLSGQATPLGIVVGHFTAEHPELEPYKLPVETFNIVHTGQIELSNPLSEIDDLISEFVELLEYKPEAVLWLAGRLSKAEMGKIAKSSAVKSIQILGSVSIQTSRSLQAAADALVIVSGPDSHALPGKVAEYAATDRPILTVGTGPWMSLLPTGLAAPFSEVRKMEKGCIRSSVSKSEQMSPSEAFLNLMQKAERESRS